MCATHIPLAGAPTWPTRVLKPQKHPSFRLTPCLGWILLAGPPYSFFPPSYMHDRESPWWWLVKWQLEVGFLAHFHKFCMVHYLMDPPVSPKDPPITAGLGHVLGVVGCLLRWFYSVWWLGLLISWQGRRGPVCPHTSSIYDWLPNRLSLIYTPAYSYFLGTSTCEKSAFIALASISSVARNSLWWKVYVLPLSITPYVAASQPSTYITHNFSLL